MAGGVAEALLERVDAIADVVRDGAAEAERLGHLTPAVIDALRDAEAFRMLVPAELGGLDLTIPESVRVFERVASYDASTGWVLAILADGPLFARFLSEAALTEVCGDPGGLICGSLNPVTARAERVDGGFSFSGTATYLSGSAHASWVMASAIVTKDGQPDVGDDGIEIRAGFFPLDRTRSLDSWHVTGMRATGSSDHAFDDVFVAEPWTFEPLRLEPTSGVHGAIPLWAQLGGGLAACAVGAARNMIDRFVELAATKVPAGGTFSRLAERAPAQIAAGEAEGLYLAARAVLHEGTGRVWARGLARRPFDNAALAEQRLATVTAVRLAAQAIDCVHGAAGMSSVKSDAVLERCWRDVHTMTQHLILSPARYEIAGRVLLGLDPGVPVI